MGEMTGDRPWTDIPRDNADLLAALVRSSNDGIYSKDARARITSWNPAAERLYGYAAAEVLGEPISILIPDDRKGEEIDILNQILEGQILEHYETVRLRKDGSTVEVSVSVSPVRDSDGHVLEAAVIARDISERRRSEEEIARAQRKEALDLNDTVVQGLAAAKMALEMGDFERGLNNFAKTLSNAKGLVDRLLDESGSIEPGNLVRSEPAMGDDDSAKT
jgi:PAS domain S-box-containing protein